MLLLKALPKFLPVGWPYYLTAAGTALAVGGIAWLWHDVTMNRLRIDHQAALNQQKAAMTMACDEDKRITTEVSHELQNQLSDARSQLARAKRVQQNRCVPVDSGPAAGHDAATPNDGLHRPHGIPADALLDFSYDAEVVGDQLDACQMYVRRIHQAIVKE